MPGKLTFSSKGSSANQGEKNHMYKRLERLTPLITGVLMIVFAVKGVYPAGKSTLTGVDGEFSVLPLPSWPLVPPPQA
jgi:hypothetical protein